MKFDINNVITGKVKFTADIDCEESESDTVKKGLAAKWAIENNINLSRTNLSGANLAGVDLSNVNLRGVNLSNADLRWVHLRGVDLRGANLSDTSFNYAVGSISPYIKFISIDRYQIIYTNKSIFIGCETYKIEEWRKFDDESIERLDGEYALEFWKKYKSFIFKAIELAPAIATK